MKIKSSILILVMMASLLVIGGCGKDDTKKPDSSGGFGVAIACARPTKVLAGQMNQAIGDFTIKETIKNSLKKDRKITFELPVWAKWTDIEETVSDAGTILQFTGMAGSKGNIVEYRVATVGVEIASLDFENFKVALDAVPAGDLIVTVGGDSGIEDEMLVAQVVSPITMTSTKVPKIKIGATAQLADLTINEGEAGAIQDNQNIYLKLPAGCEWSKIPTIQVTTGDLKLDLNNVRKTKYPAGNPGAATSDYYQFLIIPVDRDSKEASTISITDCWATVDRTVPEGNLDVALLGEAVLASNTYWGNFLGATDTAINDGYRIAPADGMFPQTLDLTTTVGAQVSSEAGGQISFYIGSTVYTVGGGKAYGIDTAPYVKSGRTLIPVRFLADALDASTAWDAASQTVTVTKGDKSIVLVIGSTMAKVNGVDVTMEVAPEITAPGRTMLPTRYVAEALGHTVLWNAALNQVIINQ